MSTSSSLLQHPCHHLTHFHWHPPHRGFVSWRREAQGSMWCAAQSKILSFFGNFPGEGFPQEKKRQIISGIICCLHDGGLQQLWEPLLGVAGHLKTVLFYKLLIVVHLESIVHVESISIHPFYRVLGAVVHTESIWIHLISHWSHFWLANVIDRSTLLLSLLSAIPNQPHVRVHTLNISSLAAFDYSTFKARIIASLDILVS